MLDGRVVHVEAGPANDLPGGVEPRGAGKLAHTATE